MNRTFLLMLAAIFLLLGSCDDEDETKVVPQAGVRQVDITVMVPIHPSSMEYFDYVIHYDDNRGEQYKDTIQGDYGGISVIDWTRKRTKSGDCYVRTFYYYSVPVSCSVTVEMVPKGGYDTLGPFIFYIPKPYIFPNVCGSAASDSDATPNEMPDGVERIQIDSMSLSTFQSTYGTIFSSHCRIDEGLDGYETCFY